MKLVDILHTDLIIHPLKKSSKVDVIKELLTLLAEKRIIQNKELILKAVLDRETIMTTGVGNGVAIPHCKSNDLPGFAMALGIHQDGVNFQSLDGKPAQIIFLLIGPENKPATHIRLLSRISRILSKSEVRQKILAGNSADIMLSLIHI